MTPSNNTNNLLRRGGQSLDIVDLLGNAAPYLQQYGPDLQQYGPDLAAAASVLTAGNPLSAILRGMTYSKDLNANEFSPELYKNRQQRLRDAQDAQDAASYQAASTPEAAAARWAKTQMAPWENWQRETEFLAGKNTGLDPTSTGVANRSQLTQPEAYQRGLAYGQGLRNNADPANGAFVAPERRPGTDSPQPNTSPNYSPTWRTGGIVLNNGTRDPGIDDKALRADLGMSEPGTAGSAYAAPYGAPTHTPRRSSQGMLTPSPSGVPLPSERSGQVATNRGYKDAFGLAEADASRARFDNERGYTSVRLSDGRSAVMNPAVADSYRKDTAARGAAPVIYAQKPTYDTKFDPLNPTAGRVTNNSGTSTVTHLGGERLAPQPGTGNSVATPPPPGRRNLDLGIENRPRV